MKRYFSFIQESPVWSKVLLFSVMIFFLRIADGIISFWAPNQIQSSLGSSFWMGIVISAQSVVGFIADLLLPTLLKSAKTRLLLIWSIILSAVTSVILIGTVYFPYILLLLLAMAIWGVYYELMNFAQYQFMDDSVPTHMHAAAWGVNNIFYSLSYFLGPLVAAMVLLRGFVLTESTFIFFLIIGAYMLIYLKIVQDAPPSKEQSEFKPFLELKHWIILSKVIWPVIVITLVLGFIDATFWTTGAVWTEKLAKINFAGGMFLSFYQLPSVILGVVVARWGVYKGKKILSEKFMIIAGLFLMAIGISSNIAWILSMVFISSAALAICYPLLEGVFTDLVARISKEGKDIVGLTSSITNVSYIIWPPIIGLIVQQIGERFTFSYLGLLVTLTAIGLLYMTPKKLRLPQQEIKTWR